MQDNPAKHTNTVLIPDAPAGRPVVVAAFYKFVALDDVQSLKLILEPLCADAGISGTILLAREGINGTICGSQESLETLFSWFKGQAAFSDIRAKFSFAEKPAFHRMKVRLKKEIVTMGEPDVDPNGCVGTYVKPEDWDVLINDPDTLVIDTRNAYEVAIGRFAGAVDPDTSAFREFPDWVKHNLDSLPESERPKNIAMYCTGGIRCEKATSYLAERGFENVYHLEGGILKYLETIPEAQSSWQGDCFVFDQRVSVGHGLAPGSYGMCHACRMPLTNEDMESPDYDPGVSCPKCFDQLSDEQKTRFRERQKQMKLAAGRGEKHLGGVRKKADSDAD